MGEADPHIHVEQRVLRAGPDIRNLMSSLHVVDTGKRGMISVHESPS